jgi:hypothetical protein
MGAQMYIVALKGGYSDDASREVQRVVRGCGGLILMVTRTGPVVALEDSRAPVVGSHPLVEYMGPVTLNPRGVAADRLQAIFADNLRRQLNVDADSQSPST